MTDTRRQKRILAVLLVVLAGAVGWRVDQMGGERAPRTARGAPPVLEDRLARIEVPSLDLEALRGEAATYAPGRNPFRFGAAPAEPAPKPSPPPRRQRPPRRQPREQTPRPAAAQPAKPQPPKVDFVYLGSFGPRERRIAVFVKNDEIFNAFVGDVLMDRFIVDKIGFESADIKFVGFPETPGTRLEAGG